MVNAATSAAVQTAVEATATNLAAAPVIGDLTVAEVCSIDNFNIAALTANGFDYSNCTGQALDVAQPPVPKESPAETSVRYEVVGKTVAQLRADMESGVTTSVEITQAYLDRIRAYDQGQFGFNAYEVVAQNELEQARAADNARIPGAAAPLLGIPVVVKNLYDTFDMPTTNGSMTFAGFLPAHDAFQIALLRKAGAVIIGKGALEEYATSGNYSNDAWGQVWNVFNPSKSSIASSGGPASALAASLAAVAMGSQTGDSLYGPSSAASLVSLRGTDGLESGTGVMPLSYLTDFGGVIARSVPDLADMLNVVVAVDPADPETSAPGRHTPADWRSVLDPNALRGKRIGYIASTWVDPFGTQKPPRSITSWTRADGALLGILVADVAGSEADLQRRPAQHVRLIAQASFGDVTHRSGVTHAPEQEHEHYSVQEHVEPWIDAQILDRTHDHIDEVPRSTQFRLRRRFRSSRHHGDCIRRIPSGFW